MILEGIVSTISHKGAPHAAPMGPLMPEDSPWTSFLLRPFTSSSTWANLNLVPAGVLHVIDDPLILARAALGEPVGPWVPATQVQGWRLADACRFLEFEIVESSVEGPRGKMLARVVNDSHGKPFFGFNRASHAVVEAAILATRLHMIPVEEMKLELDRLRPLIVKTGGARHREAFALIENRCQVAPTA